jgi:hypothetical protein
VSRVVVHGGARGGVRAAVADSRRRSPALAGEPGGSQIRDSGGVPRVGEVLEGVADRCLGWWCEGPSRFSRLSVKSLKSTFLAGARTLPNDVYGVRFFIFRDRFRG